MIRLRSLKPFCAPRRYCFKDPDTGREFHEASKPELVKRIVSYRAANKLEPIKFLDKVLENYWAGLSENAGNVMAAPPLQRGLVAYLKGGIALLDNLWYGEKHMVPQATANARAAQCATCKFNVFPDKSRFVAWSDMMAEASVGDKRVEGYDALGNCEVCSCPLKAKVWYRGKNDITPEQREKMLEVNCWQISRH